MRIEMCIYIHVYMYTRIRVHVCIHLHMYIYIRIQRMGKGKCDMCAVVCSHTTVCLFPHNSWVLTYLFLFCPFSFSCYRTRARAGATWDSLFRYTTIGLLKKIGSITYIFPFVLSSPPTLLHNTGHGRGRVRLGPFCLFQSCTDSRRLP